MSSVRARIKTAYLIGDTTPSLPTTAKVSGDMSDDIVGPITEIANIDQVCYYVAWTSADAVGIISIQGSVDGTNFEDLTFTTPLAQPDSNNGSYLVNLALLPFSYIRPVYTRTSGSGDLVVSLSAKGA